MSSVRIPGGRDGKGSGDGTLVLCCITESSEGGALDEEEHEDTEVVSSDTLVEVDVGRRCG